jgi:hypothetical protein
MHAAHLSTTARPHCQPCLLFASLSFFSGTHRRLPKVVTSGIIETPSCPSSFSTRARGSTAVVMATAMRTPAAAAAAASAALIEVERKFAADVPIAELRARVSRLGGTEMGVVEITDTYYDTPSCQLASRDVWLRRRDDSWELKAGGGGGGGGL